MSSDRVHVLGVRHHGPGSARALVRALDELRPDLILVEGPPEADGLVALAAHEDLEPPVALLAYPTAATAGKGGVKGRAAFWPFAVFSPEWQALRWAVEHDVPLRFCDLPAGHRFAAQATEDAGTGGAEPDGPLDAAGPQPDPSTATAPVDGAAPGAAGEPVVADEAEPAEGEDALRVDPIAGLAQAAGYDDPERWWEDVIEHRRDVPPFAAVAEAMAAVRESAPVIGEDLVREAYMRQVLRAALKEGHQRIAVVCGAWHVPALTGELPPAKADAVLLKGLPTVPTTVTWVPWTHGRLASWSGYGAGVTAPGWYHHLFTAEDQPVERWLVGVAGVLRGEDLPVSSAHVIESVRLADTLAVLRGRPLPGLAEVTEATRAVLCDGDDTRLELVQRKVVVGERLGRVPADAPAVPLARDLAATAKRLKLAQQALITDHDLDLRKPNDLERSRLLHRLRLLGVGWGTPGQRKAGKGTFWESWRLQWHPEYAVDLIEASAYGVTVEQAATAKTVESAAGAELPVLTGLLEACLLADLPGAQPRVLQELNDRAAVDTDVAQLMAAVPALARSLRYGDVRATSTEALAEVLTGLVTRIRLGLPGALTGLDDDAARALREHLDGTHEALNLLADRLPLREEWLAALARLVDRPDLPGLLAGRLLRLLRDAGSFDADAVELRLSRALTVGVLPTTAAGYVEGFIAGGGLLLVHDEALLSLVDRWLTGLAPDTFTAVLPLLRRTFAAFAAPERRAVGEKVRHLGSGGTRRTGSDLDDLDLDEARVARVVPTLELLLAAGRGTR
ncbi:hypothetical protein CS0771_28300 [Catellatospora sp. IY07-71]|uniref:DUF5682 family protein n=1 Tax=Catellatospora sp. IY07-71 TaxID=2728827 RepID=UPI001BB3D44F|nr:DUF5682 family protein [Catellatospora sp. IY07-71]BCJ73286.1 hypothetical protein CS0771_28300 [Catellatospora sp. IY07-71]